MKKLKDQITSSEEAAHKAAKLTSVVAGDTYLSLQVLIYCASLLEQLVAQKKTKKPRAQSAWQKFVAAELRAGSSIQAASAKWQEQKNKS